MGFLDVWGPVGHGFPSGRFPVPVGNRKRQRGSWPDQKPDGGQGSVCAGRNERKEVMLLSALMFAKDVFWAQ